MKINLNDVKEKFHLQLETNARKLVQDYKGFFNGMINEENRQKFIHEILGQGSMIALNQMELDMRATNAKFAKDAEKALNKLNKKEKAIVKKVVKKVNAKKPPIKKANKKSKTK